MNTEFIKGCHVHLTYKLAEGTKTSYRQVEGPANILPNRIGITREQFSYVNNTGGHRDEKKVGQAKSQFTKKEVSPYKMYKPFQFHTTIYHIPGYPVFIGYGDVGTSSCTGGTVGSKDLVVLHSPDGWETVNIHLFEGLLFQKDDVFAYLYKFIKQQGQD